MDGPSALAVASLWDLNSPLYVRGVGDGMLVKPPSLSLYN